MPTPDETATSIENAVAHEIEVDGAQDVAIDKAIAAMRSAADALAAGANALHTARNAHNMQANTIRDDLRDSAAMVRDLPVTAPTVSFPGDPGSGKIRWGAAIGGNADPVARHETVAGVPMGLRRTFWDMSKTAKLVATCAADHAAGRVPWVSVKLGTSWANVAAGNIDTALLDLFAKLRDLGKPVWFTAHHEPEGGNGTPYPDDGQGTEVHWREMQSHISLLLFNINATNVAFAPILMSWTFDPRSKRNPADWWVPGIWDFVGIDHYVDAESTMLNDTWSRTRAFYEGKGLRIAIGEWGNRGTDTAAADRMDAWYDHLRDIGSPGCCAFDSGLNAPSGSWELKGVPLDGFRLLMAEASSVRGVS